MPNAEIFRPLIIILVFRRLFGHIFFIKNDLYGKTADQRIDTVLPASQSHQDFSWRLRRQRNYGTVIKFQSYQLALLNGHISCEHLEALVPLNFSQLLP